MRFSYQQTSNGPKVKARDEIIAITWNLVDRSLTSAKISLLSGIVRSTIDTKYSVRLAGEKVIGVDTIICDCTLNFLNHPSNIDLMPIEIGSFDVIIGIGWLTKYHAMIICEKKMVNIPLGGETLTIRSNMSDGYASIVASEQRAELFIRIGTLEQDNMILRGMLGVERQRVDRLRRSMSYAQRDL
uniref:Reverse transcriptase domain-containing protein n=1 Tax=Tanacetum cinerariifolium TaxID=118510 RepID=A0A699H636_TANCI|nr:reverse transcriptase domain-containing protein [Tanacetum cinerariifolium]